MQQNVFLYTIHLADNALLLAQRNSEWTGHGPVLEQDIAITNISLDLLGQARNFYQYAAGLYNASSGEEKGLVEKYIPRPWKEFNRALEEDDLAFLRDEHQFLNILLVELPKGDWAQTVLRQFFFSAYQFYLYRQLETSSNASLAGIAEKSLKEVTYHLRWSSEWVIRLGDGTEESHQRILRALEDQWSFTGEIFAASAYEHAAGEEGWGIDPASLKDLWLRKVEQVFESATIPFSYGETMKGWMQSGGKQGRHTEHLGYLLAEMQYLQRTFPNSVW
jgi:ring-1,2-phenylacetyl-CoA epoxidase subunit PaaC